MDKSSIVQNVKTDDINRNTKNTKYDEGGRINKMDITKDQVGFVSNLLQNTDLLTVQHVFQNCLLVTNQIIGLEHTIDKLHYSVLAGCYRDGIGFANECRNQFDIYKNHVDKYYINKIYNKYVEILKKITVKLLDEFDIVDRKEINTQLEQAGELLNLLSDKERADFLNNLSKKICASIPNVQKGEFYKFYKEQLNWIFIVFDDTEKYKVLDKWHFKEYVVDTWADTIRNIILKEEIKHITVDMIEYVKDIETKIISKINSNNKYAAEFISVSLDFFYNHKIQEITETYKHPELNNLVEHDSTILKSATELIFILKDYDRRCQGLINKRNVKLLTSFYESTIHEYLCELFVYYKKNMDTIFDAKDANTFKIMKDTLDYITKVSAELKNKYTSLNLSTIKIDLIKTEMYNLIYLKYKNKCLTLIDNSLSKYQNGFVDTLKQKTRMTTTNKVNDNKVIDISQEIVDVIQIIKSAINVDSNFGIYISGEINLYYKISIEPYSSKYNKLFLDQILMDIGMLKDTFKSYANLFSDNQNKIKFLLSDVDNEPIFIEQFKTFYKDHNLELLRQILKYKNIDTVRMTNILKCYGQNIKK
jgi:hypothetical protein